jgi:hypothetical protein
MTPPTAPVLAAWQAALAAEHAAVFGYGTLGPRLPATDQALARASERAHRAIRDAVATAITGIGATPVTSAPDYPLPFPVTTAARARAYAARLEGDAASAWRYLIATAATGPGVDAAIRIPAQQYLTAAASRGLRWRRLTDPATASVAFPGI